MLERLEFKIFENLFGDKWMEDLHPAFQKMGEMPFDYLIKFLGEYTTKQAVLLYCSTEVKNKLLNQFDFATYIDDGVSHMVLRNLDEVREGRFRLLITDDANTGLRGLDLRAFNNGVAFMSMRSFRHQREML